MLTTATDNYSDRQFQNEKEKEVSEKIPEEVLREKFISHFGNFEEYSLRSIAKRCARLIVSEYYKELCYDIFEFPSDDDMKRWVLEEMKQNFEEKIMPIVEMTYPGISDDELDALLNNCEKLYEKEYETQLDSTTDVALKELKLRVKGLQKELKALKRKYTI